MCIVRCSNYDELDLRVSENIIQRSIDLGGYTKPLFDFAAFGSRIALKHGVQRKDLWQRQNERDMEGQPSEPNTEDTSKDRTSHGGKSQDLELAKTASRRDHGIS